MFLISLKWKKFGQIMFSLICFVFSFSRISFSLMVLFGTVRKTYYLSVYTNYTRIILFYLISFYFLRFFMVFSFKESKDDNIYCILFEYTTYKVLKRVKRILPSTTIGFLSSKRFKFKVSRYGY